MSARSTAGLRIAGRALTKLFDAAEAAGLPRAELARTAGFDLGVLGDRDARVPLSELFSLWESAMRTIRDPGFPLTVATQYAPGDYEIVGFIAMTSEDVEQGLLQVQRFTRLWIDGARWELSREPSGDVELAYELAGSDRLGGRCSVESGLAELVHAARAVTMSDLAPREVRIAHRAPDDAGVAHVRFFSSKVVWGAPRSAIVFRAEDLRRRLVKADPALRGFLVEQAEARLEAIAGDETWRGRVRREIESLLPSGEPSLADVATRLGSSERTVRRRLDEESTGFRDLVDEVRRERALRLIDDERLTLTDVALLLGFSEPSPLHRAFRRWTGMTPAEYRRRPS